MIKKVLIGISAGFICGFFSTGGGMILVPSFVYILNKEPEKSRATSVFCILPMVLTSSFFYYKNNYIDWKTGILCAIGGIFNIDFLSVCFFIPHLKIINNWIFTKNVTTFKVDNLVFSPMTFVNIFLTICNSNGNYIFRTFSRNRNNWNYYSH